MDDNRLDRAKARSIKTLAEGYGIPLKKAGQAEWKMICPHIDHKDTSPSCYVNVNSNLFHCGGCGWAGSSIDFVMGVEGLGTDKVAISKAIDIIVGEAESSGMRKDVTKMVAKNKKRITTPENKTGQWDYVDAAGKKIYSSIRYDSDGEKEFLLATWVNGSLEFGLSGDVKRVPLHLDRFPDHQEVWLAEGEKCSDAINKLGIFATNIAQGSNAKLDGIADYFVGMDVVLLPDNDKGGRDFMKAFSLKLEGVAKSVRVLDIGTPRNKKGYDVFDWIEERKGESMTTAEIRDRLLIRKEASLYMFEGEPVEILNDKQRDAEYQLMLTLDGFDLGDFIPDLKGVLRPFVRGDCLGIVGGTGSGKTAMLGAISEWAAPMTILNFNLELSTGVFYEREVSSTTGISAVEVEKAYLAGKKPSTGGKLSHIYTVTASRITPDEIRKQFWRFVRFTGLWPEWVLVDYVQLLKGTGQRYDRTTDNAEEIRIMAKELDTRMAFTSQKSRSSTSKKEGAKDLTPTLHDAKDSGGLENSMSVYMDIRPHPDHVDVKKGIILKNTRGPAGVEFDIGWIGSCTKFQAGGLQEPDPIPDMFEDVDVPDHSEPKKEDIDVPF